MFIVGENLRSLISGHSICSETSFDGSSISVKLGPIIFKPAKPRGRKIKYGLHEVDDLYEKTHLDSGELLLRPKDCVLACSSERINMPLGYIGFIQTKGTLARMFVITHCADPQIDPGFCGKITLEIVNLSPFEVVLPVGSPVAQLFWQDAVQPTARLTQENMRIAKSLHYHDPSTKIRSNENGLVSIPVCW
jgi:dCTP deaminase